MNDALRRAANLRLQALQTLLSEVEIALEADCYGDALDKWSHARTELNALAADLLVAHLAQPLPATDETRAQLRATLRQLSE